MKKTLLSMVLALAAMSAAAQDQNDWHFSINADGTATVVCFNHTTTVWINGMPTEGVTDRNCYSGDAVIPSTYEGHTVTAIGEGCFRDCDNLTSVKIPNTIKTIGSVAFENCSPLKELTIPASVESLGSNAVWNGSIEQLIFEDSPNTLTIPTGYEMFRTLHSLNYIYQGRNIVSEEALWPAFCMMGGPVETIEQGPQVTQIAEAEFQSNTSLHTLVLSPNLKEIPKNAFSWCTSLADVTWPEALTAIGESAFSHCEALKTLPSLEHLTVISGYAFSECKAITKVVIPANVDSLGYGAFMSNDALVEVVIEDGERVLKMGSGEMFGRPAPSLLKAYIGRDYEGGQYGVFQFNPSLEEVTFGGHTTHLRTGEFSNCSSLKTVHLGVNMNKIGDYAFGGWTDHLPVTTLICDAVEPPVCEGGSNSNALTPIDKETCTLYVPAGSIEAYKAAYQWKDFFNIESGIRYQQTDSESAVDQWYRLDGQRLDSPLHGINIMRQKDGIKRKVLVK